MNDPSLNRTKPHNLEYERAVLGGILLDNENISIATSNLKATDFYDERHRMIFTAILSLVDQKKPVDALILKDELQGSQGLDKWGGPQYLVSLTDGFALAMNVQHYAEVVREKAMLRRLIEYSSNLMMECYENNTLPHKILEKCRGRLSEFESQLSCSDSFIPPEYWQFLDVADISDWDCESLEWIIEGVVAKGNLVLVAGMTQTGKTLLWLYMTLLMLCGGKLFGRLPVNPVRKALYVTLEDPPRRIRDRILEMRGDFEIEPGQFNVYFAHGLAISDPNYFAHLRDLIIKNKYDLVVIDTYQKATPGISSFNDEQQSEILHRLSNLTRELGVTIIVLDHIRKTLSGKKRNQITVDDIKGTGGKAQNADCYILMEREGSNLKFQAFSKDSDRPVGFLLKVSPEGSTEEKFTYAGDLEEFATQAKQMAAKKKQAIIEAMTDLEWTSTGEISKKTGIPVATVRRRMNDLIDDGKVRHNGAKGKQSCYQLINQSQEHEECAIEQTQPCQQVLSVTKE